MRRIEAVSRRQRTRHEYARLTDDVLALLEDPSDGGFARDLLPDDRDRDQQVAQFLNAVDDPTVDTDRLMEDGAQSAFLRQVTVARASDRPCG